MGVRAILAIDRFSLKGLTLLFGLKEMYVS